MFFVVFESIIFLPIKKIMLTPFPPIAKIESKKIVILTEKASYHYFRPQRLKEKNWRINLIFSSVVVSTNVYSSMPLFYLLAL